MWAASQAGEESKEMDKFTTTNSERHEPADNVVYHWDPMLLISAGAIDYKFVLL